MDMRYLQFCHPGTAYYDLSGTAPVDLPAASADLPAGWSRRLDADWCYLRPPEFDLPDQGWKIHVSATADNAERVLKVVWEYCTQHRVMFKFIRSQWVLLRRNSKYGDRGGSGKFITIFPPDESCLETTLADLGPRLDGERGPYILTDLRIGAGPLYVRYGGFVARMAAVDGGEPVHCITDPQGRPVPDRRKPGFHVPEWVDVPGCLTEHVAARNTGTLRDFPFRATKALHFSNGGGVYEATHTTTGDRILLKEARPLAGVDESGHDAVQRLDREHWAMQQLSDLDCVPRLIDYRIGNEHYFLAREFVEGRPLIQLFHERNPLVNRASTDSVAGYTEWALSVIEAAADALTAIHDRGVVFGDVHPNNILIRPDGGVVFIDFETSTPVGEDRAQQIGAPGFRAPEGYRGVAADWYGFGCLRLSAFLPATVTLAWGAEKVDQLLDAVHQVFPVPARFADQVRADLGVAASAVATGIVTGDARPVWSDLVAAGWPAVRRELAEHILSTATPERDDRLYPGDITQFTVPGGGVTVIAGASGVVMALQRAGIPVPDQHLDWIFRHAMALPDPRPGFGDGLAGVALALAESGRDEQAREVLRRALAHPFINPVGGLHSGSAGVGLVLLALHDRYGDSALLDHAGRLAAGITRAQPDDATRAANVRRRPGGLLHGESGTALFALRLFEATGQTAQLDQAVDLVRADLGALGWGQQPDPQRTTPAWDNPSLALGGAGVAMVLRDLLTMRPDPDLARARDAIVVSLLDGFTANAGLLHGRAGSMIALRHAAGTGLALDEAMAAQATALGLHAVRVPGGTAFLGDHGLRLSVDLGTGAAGVLLGLSAAIAGRGRLPFFDSGPRTPGR